MGAAGESDAVSDASVGDGLIERSSCGLRVSRSIPRCDRRGMVDDPDAWARVPTPPAKFGVRSSVSARFSRSSSTNPAWCAPCLLTVGPVLPCGDGPEQKALAVIDQGCLPCSGQNPPELLHHRDHVAVNKLQIGRRTPSRYLDLLVGIDIASYARRAGLLNRGHPRSWNQQAIDAPGPELGCCRPPRSKFRVLEIAMAEFMPEGSGETVESVLLPQVDDLRPPSGAAHDTPHAVAELVSILLRRGAPIRRHVVHVAPTVMPNDVDVLVDVDLVVDGRVHRRHR